LLIIADRNPARKSFAQVRRRRGDGRLAALLCRSGGWKAASPRP